MNTEGKPLSFSFKKKVTNNGTDKNAKPNVFGVDEGNSDEVLSESITHFDGDESVEKKVKKKTITEMAAIPLITENVWYGQNKEKEGKENSNNKRKADDKKTEKKSTETEEEKPKDAESELIDAVVEEWTGAGKKKKQKLDQDHIPLLVRNAPPIEDVDEEGNRINDADKFKKDVEYRPDQCTKEQYEAMPIELFGTLLLKGMMSKEEQDSLEEEF
eukprot:Pgem_evm1s5791